MLAPHRHAHEVRDRVSRHEIDPKAALAEAMDPLADGDSVNGMLDGPAPAVAAPSWRPVGGPLAGTTFTVKDNIAVQGRPTTYGSRALLGATAPADAVVVSRLRGAGSAFVGRTSLPEFATRPVCSDSLAHGTTVNPVDPTAAVGGSSGGAAATLAAGIGDLALGSDGGGSARLPAACCGVIGMRPSRGLVSSAPQSFEQRGGISTIAPMARCVRDLALLLDVVAGTVTGDPYSVQREESYERRALEGPRQSHRIGVLIETPHGAAHGAPLTAVEHCAADLEASGHDVDVVHLPPEGWHPLLFLFVQVGVAAAVSKLDPDHVRLLERNTVELAERGASVTGADYADAMDEARRRAAAILQAVEPFDALIAPTLASDVPDRDAVPNDETPFDERWRRYLDFAAFTQPFNLTGQPAVSIPYDVDRSGRPVGLQVIGRQGKDGAALGLALWLQDRRSGRRCAGP